MLIVVSLLDDRIIIPFVIFFFIKCSVFRLQIGYFPYFNQCYIFPNYLLPPTKLKEIMFLSLPVYLPVFLFVCEHYVDHSLCWSIVQNFKTSFFFSESRNGNFLGSRSNLGHENPVFGHDFCSICCRNLKYVSCCRLWINGHCMTLTLVFDP